MSSSLSPLPERAKRSSQLSENSKESATKQNQTAIKTSSSRQCLDAPSIDRSRTSNDTLSEVSSLSLDYQADNESHRPFTKSLAVNSRWRQRLDNGWARNKGLILVILAQLFGALMGVTTRLLETDGSHGPGMHPFQVASRSGISAEIY